MGTSPRVQRPSRSDGTGNHVGQAHQFGGATMWITQWVALIRKHCLVLAKSPVMLTLALLGPALMIFAASATTSALSSAILPRSEQVNTTTPIQLKYPACTTDYCRPVYYYAPNDPYHASVMDAFAQISSLRVGKTIGDGDIVGFASIDDMMSGFYRDATKLSSRIAAFVVPFTTFDGVGPVSSFADAADQLKKRSVTSYTLVSSKSQRISSLLPWQYMVYNDWEMSSKIALDTAIISVRRAMSTGKTAGGNGKLALSLADMADINVSVASFPIVRSKDEADMDAQIEKGRKVISASLGNMATSAILTIGFFPLILLINKVAAQDKHQALLGVLRKLSLLETAYWASLATVVTAMALVIGTMSVIAAAIAGHSSILFGNCSLLVIFFLQFLYALAISSFTLLAVAAISHPYASTIVMLASLDFRYDPRATGVFARAWDSMYDSTVKAVSLSLFPFFHYGRIINIIAQTILQPSGVAYYSFGHLSQQNGPFPADSQTPGVTYSVPTASAAMGVMFALFLGYLLLCCLLNQIIVGRSGGAKRLFGSRRGSSLGVNAQLAKQSRQSNSVIVDGVTKKFGNFTAVNGMSMTMRKGRCLALLGHNGAGKSTLINMLSGLLSPTSGNAYVFGRPLTQDTTAIQRVLGTCPQHDIQYPQLSAREHLRLYARFKGIPVSELNEYIDERLDLVGLLGQADQPVGEFSGGMKRRLSIVSAGIGSPQFIILDEPTTGMDPINRRKVWQYIARLKRDSVLLLTSHSMEETDALGDDICIVDHGEVQTTGTSLQLKNAHGTGYQVNLLTWQGRVEELRAFVAEALPQAQVSAATATSLSVVVGREHMQLLPKFLATLQTTMRLPESERVVKDWGIQNASLEQVFLKLTRKVEDPSADAQLQDEMGQYGSDGRSLPRLVGSFTLPSQLWAMIAKNTAFQLKQRKSLIFFIVFILGLIGGMVYALTQLRGEPCAAGYMPFSVPHAWGDATRPVSSCDLSTVSSAASQAFKSCGPQTPFFCNTPDYGGLKQVDYLDAPSVQVWVAGADDAMVSLMKNQAGSRFVQQSDALTQFAQASKSNASVSAINRPFDIIPAININDRILAAQLQNRQDASNSSTQCPSSEAPLIQDYVVAAQVLKQNFPDRAIAIQDVPTHATLLYWGDSTPFASYQSLLPGRSGQCLLMTVNQYGATRGPISITGTFSNMPTIGALDKWDDISSQWGSGSSGLRRSLGALTNTYARMLVGDGEAILSADTKLEPVQFNDPQHSACTLIMVLIVLWLFPIYLMVPFSEREERLFAYFKVNGLSTMAYWLGNYCYDLLFGLPIVIILTVVIKVYVAPVNVGLLFLVLLLGVHSTIGFAFFYASIAQSSPMGRMLTYTLPIIFTLLSFIVIFKDVLGGTPFSNVWACLFPPLGLAYSLRVVLRNTDLGFLVGPALMMLVMGAVLIALAVLMTNLADRSGGAVDKVKAMLSGSRRTAKKADPEGIELTSQSERTTDPDVLDEVARVDGSDKTATSLAVRIQHLSKYFGSFAAVNDLTLGLEQGECFGLLGPNGSGKTTTVTMLGGTLVPSKGNATVGGYDTSDPRLPGVLGLCPQDDRVMKDLTVEENLLFFARVRGASNKAARAYARHAAGMVGLSGVAYTRAAEHLSGGMRRRLSIAVALIGLPPVIILDEPTTGLDPGNRTQIWDIISNIRDRREHCIILISHLMEEVDALTSRIGIMAAGSLRCLGNQVSLKNRFASGYSLYVQLEVAVAADQTGNVREMQQAEAAQTDAVTRFVLSHVCSRATFAKSDLESTAVNDPKVDAAANTATWMVNFQYRLPGDADLGRAFSQMAREAGSLGVVEWSLNQSSLEDVFVTVATRYIK
ncbi:hypothetical protein RI367_004614 [Sorochytrium milnesiophthora]